MKILTYYIGKLTYYIGKAQTIIELKRISRNM